MAEELEDGQAAQQVDEVSRRKLVLLSARYALGNAQLAALSGFDSTDEFRSWKIGRAAPTGAEAGRRLLLLLGVLERVDRSFGTAEKGRAWLHRPNTRFGHLSPLKFMLNGGASAIGAVALHLAPRSTAARQSPQAAGKKGENMALE